MGWSIGTGEGGRDIGYGVPALCDHPGCNKEINRGLSYCCGGFFNDGGCKLYFCEDHLRYGEDENGEWVEYCDACWINNKLGSDNWELHVAYHEPKPDILKWVVWKYYDESWQQWRDEEPDEAKKLFERISVAPKTEIDRLMNYLWEGAAL